MRKKMPEIPRAFKTPLVPFVPIAGIVVCLVLMYSLPLESWMRLFVWMGLGVVIYFIYGKKNSKINNE
jgi:APA family basic amino acid/polyamine antiporter